METIKTLDDLQKYIEKWCNDPKSVSGDNESVFDELLLDNQVIHISITWNRKVRVELI